ncbi:MAG: alpha/beta fold hydrolase [Acetobacteraceae bacterium]|nr:alpha/beta fold hydrolase [Acetobacteraceae bacterium]
MMRRLLTWLVSGLLLLPAASWAHDALQPQDGDVELHDFALQSGEHIPLLKLHYTTLGTARRDAAGKVTNAVLLLHGTTGTGKGYLAPTLADNLFRPGQPLDVKRYFIVLPDGIGIGGSTKPSDGLHAHFPHYGYTDQVEAQHAMLLGMGIAHVKLVSGISQGGMQTWMWGERFPDAMDALVPVASMPMQISGRNLIWRQIIIRSIRNDPAWMGGDYDPAHPPTLWMQTAAPLFALMVGNPEKLQALGPDRAKTLAAYDDLVAQYRTRDANDYLYDFESSADYDPAGAVDRIKAPMLAINFADDAVNPVQFTATRQTIMHLKSGRLVVLPGGESGYGHAGIFHAELWGPAMAKFLHDLPGWQVAAR